MSDCASYRSIFLEPDWAHQKYFGWRTRDCAPGLRILSKTVRGAERLLALVEPGQSVASLAAGIPARLTTAEITVHAFEAGEAASFSVNGRAFAPLANEERLLNIATYVIDLSQDEEALMGAMSSDYRRKIRKATGAGVSVVAVERPDTELVQEFSAAFGRLAQDRGLAAFDPGAYSRMYAAGDAILYVLRQDGENAGYLHVYKAGPSAIFMTGVTPAKAHDGAGQFLHWEIIRDLKRRGLRWYDLGGVRSFDDADGISRFKKGFGGGAINLGAEWRWRAAWLKGALAARRAMSGAR
ncbi:MAG: GNAT family N-acetyltransferase [Rhodoblastus sp.]